MPIAVVLNTDDFQHGIDQFFASLSWDYLANRYPVEAQGLLLRLLTLSGLDPACWAPCTMQLVAQPDSLLAKVLVQKKEVEAAQLVEVVAQIQEYAMCSGASMREPPLSPLYLLGYGYTQDAYINDLHRLYGPTVVQSYRTPWPMAAAASLQKFTHQPTWIQRSVAVMGLTAGAIERLMALGAGNGPNP